MKKTSADNPMNPDPGFFIGTSGFFYPDWKGVFYQNRLKQDEYLDYYSRFFNALELNFSFYQMPETGKLRRFADPGLNNLAISIKAYRGITHQEADPALLDTFMKRLRVLEDAGVLKTVLFQFPFAFRENPDAWKKLERIAASGRTAVPVVEFRNSRWLTDDNIRRFREMGLVVCATDMPTLRDLPGCRFHTTHTVGYMRFHGRNSGRWWNHREAWERYDYLYSRNELMALVPDMKKWFSRLKTAYVFFNNHYRGQAVQNGQMLMAFLAD